MVCPLCNDDDDNDNNSRGRVSRVVGNVGGGVDGGSARGETVLCRGGGRQQSQTAVRVETSVR